MLDLSIVNAVKGELLINKFGDSSYTTFSSEDRYGNTLYHKANDLDPNKYYIVNYRKDKDTHPIQEVHLISSQSLFDYWF